MFFACILMPLLPVLWYAGGIVFNLSVCVCVEAFSGWLAVDFGCACSSRMLKGDVIMCTVHICF